MIRSFIQMGMCFARLGKNLGTNFVYVGKSFARFGVEIACAFRGCDGDGSGCCR